MDRLEVRLDPPRTEAYFRTAWAVSNALNRLGLPADLHNHLVSLLTEHAAAVERSGFLAGVRCGMESMRGSQG